MAPSKTLYVSNLSEKLKQADLRRVLFMLFSLHGRVLDIVAKRKDGMRGQAFVVFDSLAAATNARRSEDGKQLLGKPMVS